MVDFLFPLLKNSKSGVDDRGHASDRGHRLRITHTHRRRGLNSVDLFLLPSVCKQPMVNGWQELGRLFHKQKIGENGMAIKED